MDCTYDRQSSHTVCVCTSVLCRVRSVKPRTLNLTDTQYTSVIAMQGDKVESLPIMPLFFQCAVSLL